MSKISIITTTYKHEKFVGQTIDSILSQTFTDWELLIGDDSPDNATWDIIQTYVEKYPDKIKAWHNSPNKGIVDNMNYLVDKINPKSQYVTFLEGDDLYTPDNFERKLEIFEKYPEVVLVYNNLDFIDAKNKVILKDFFKKKNIKYYFNESLSETAYIKHNTGPICSRSTSMIKKEILDEIKIKNPINKDPLYSVSDYDFYFRVSTKYKIYGIEDSMTLYRRHAGNLSGQYLKLFNDLEELMNYYFKNKFITEKNYKYKLSWINILKAVSTVYNDKKDSLKYTIKSFKLSPFSDLFYKIGSLGLLLTPNFILKKVLNKLIVR